MNVAFGLKAHSGWAALVVLGARGDASELIDRRRIDLVEKDDAHWAKQPYHAAEGQRPEKARETVGLGVESARRLALREMRAALKRASDSGHKVKACAVLVGAPMPASWSVDEILAVHIRMHKAEGVLFRDALGRAAEASGVKLVQVPEKTLVPFVEAALATPARRLMERISALGKAAGPPWGKDQKDAALAALFALEGRAI